MQQHSIRWLTTFCLFTVAVTHHSAAHAQLRVVTYNTTPTNDLSRLRRVLSEIGNEIVNGISRPIDILALQEQGSQEVETQQVLDILDDLYGEGVYARGTVDGAGFFTQGVIYRTDTVELLDEVRVGATSSQGAARQTLRYQFRPVGYKNADFYVYNSHFKANNNPEDAARRGVEAAAIRRNADSLGEVPIIFLGDLNLYSDQSPGYQAFTADGPSRAFDPIEMEGDWHRNPDYKIVHTQSSTVTGGDNRAGGGVDDRFDFQLVTNSLMDGEGLSYIGPNIPNVGTPVSAHSYRVFGNNGTHTLGSHIGSGTAASRVVLRSLETASDHLPVVVDYQLPARPETSAAYHEKVIIGASASGTLQVRNAAPVDHAIGADELKYSVVGPHGLAAVGTVLSDSDGDQVAFELDADEIGSHAFDLVVETSNSMVDQSSVVENISYVVVDHANASFAAETKLNEVVIELGEHTLNSEVEFEIPIHNLMSEFGATADLVIERAMASDALEFSSLPLLVKPGQSAGLTGKFAANQLGSNSNVISVFGRDESLPGAHSFGPLQVTLTAFIVDLLGDFDSTGALDVSDIDTLTRAVASGGDDLSFDLNGDRSVDGGDRQFWVTELRNTYFGDSNLDGEFNSADFVVVFRAGEYDDGIGRNSTWATGDWNGDSEFDSSDFVLAFSSGGYEKGPRIRVVPETQTLGGLSIAFLAWMRRRSRRN